MGLSASQARFLMLTGQQSDLEYQAQQITNQRMLLANETKQAAEAYNAAIDNTVLVFRGYDKNEYSLTYSSLIAPTTDNPPGLGMYLTNDLGKKVVADKSEIPDGADVNDYIVDNDLKKYEHFARALKEGIYFISTDNPKAGEMPIQNSLSEMALVSEIYDTTDDARAEAKYTEATEKLNDKDKDLDLALDNINTKHEAIQTEIESVQKVMEKNIETTFNIFS